MGDYMGKIINLSLFLLITSLFLTGCNNSKEETVLDINESKNTINTNNNQITSNKIYLKETNNKELINIIETVEKNKPTM